MQFCAWEGIIQGLVPEARRPALFSNAVNLRDDREVSHLSFIMLLCKTSRLGVDVFRFEDDVNFMEG